MATLLSRFEEALGDLANFDLEDLPDGTNDAATAAYVAKVNELILRVGPGGSLGCLMGCLPAYFECRRDNPNYPPLAICDALLDQCRANCQQQ